MRRGSGPAGPYRVLSRKASFAVAAPKYVGCRGTPKQPCRKMQACHRRSRQTMPTTITNSDCPQRDVVDVAATFVSWSIQPV